MKTPAVPAAYVGELSEIYLRGYSRGWNVASWNDIPEIGSTLPRSVDYEGLGEIEDEADQADALQMLASSGESSDRDFSPFEFTAKEFNDREDADEAWEAFDAGISDGISANIASRIAL